LLDPFTANKISSIIQIIILIAVGIILVCTIISGLIKTGIIPGLDVRLAKREMVETVIRERRMKQIQMLKAVADLKLEKEEEYYTFMIAKKMNLPVEVVRDKLKKPVQPMHILLSEKPKKEEFEPLFDLSLVPEIVEGEYSFEEKQPKLIKNKNIPALPQGNYNSNSNLNNSQTSKTKNNQASQEYSINCPECGRMMTYVRGSNINSQNANNPNVPTHFHCRVCGVNFKMPECCNTKMIPSTTNMRTSFICKKCSRERLLALIKFNKSSQPFINNIGEENYPCPFCDEIEIFTQKEKTQVPAERR